MNKVVEANNETATSEQFRSRPVFQPRIDLWETTADWNLVADLPGVRADDLNIVIQEGVLTLEAKTADRDVEGQWRHREYAVGDFRRTFQLGESLSVDRAEATLKDGVLTLRLPKHESVMPRKIAIRQA
jgi:HSP20 family protein